MRKIILFLVTLLLISCTKAPDCHDENVKKTVLELAPKLIAEKCESAIPMVNPIFTLFVDRDTIKNAVEKEVNKFNYSIRNSRIDLYDEKIDKYFCSAELVMINKNNPEEKDVIHIVYTSQLVDKDKKIYVTLKLSDEEELKFLQGLLKLKIFY